MPEFMTVWAVLGCNNNSESWVVSVHDSYKGAQTARNSYTEVEHDKDTFYKDLFYIEEYRVTDD